MCIDWSGPDPRTVFGLNFAVVIPGERDAFSAPALAAAFAKATAGQVGFTCRGEAFRRSRGEVPTEASAEVGEGGMDRVRPLRFARKCSLSTSPAARGRKGSLGRE